MDEKQMLRTIIEQYALTGSMEHGEIKVERVQDGKTTYVEPGVGGDRSIYLNEYKVNGKVLWAGYSSRNRKVYVSLSG